MGAFFGAHVCHGGEVLLALMGVFDGRRVAELIAVSAASRPRALHVLGRERMAPPWRCSG